MGNIVKKNLLIPIERPLIDRFKFGNCATIAIAQAFNTSEYTVEVLFRSINANPLLGVTHYEVRKVVHLLKEKKIPYNSTKRSLYSFTKKYNKGKYLLSLDNHLTYLEDGVLYDAFYSNFKAWLMKAHLLGYWKLS